MSNARENARKRADMKRAFANSPFRHTRRIMLRWLKGVFKSFEPGCYRYLGDRDPANEIMLTSQAPVKFENEEKRPLIVYQRMPTMWNNPGFGAGPIVQSARLSTGVQRKTSLLSGNIGFHCCSRVPDEAEHLAWIVSFWLRECLPLLTGMQLFQLGTPAIGQVAPAPDSLVQVNQSEWVFCTTSVPYSFQYSWDSSPKEDTRIESIEVELVDEVEDIIQSFLTKKE